MTETTAVRGELPRRVRTVLAVVDVGLLVQSTVLVVRRWQDGGVGFWGRAAPQFGLMCIGVAMLVQLYAPRRRWLYALSAALLVASLWIVTTVRSG